MGIQVSECIWGERIADSPMFESALQHAQCALHGRYDQFQTYIDPNVDHQQIIRYHQGPQHLSGSEKQCVRQRLRLSPLRRMLLPDNTPSQRRPGRMAYFTSVISSTTTTSCLSPYCAKSFFRCSPFSADLTVPLTAQPFSRRERTTQMAMKPFAPLTRTFELG